jgi:hypothetical protein
MREIDWDKVPILDDAALANAFEELGRLTVDRLRARADLVEALNGIRKEIARLRDEELEIVRILAER